MRSPSVRVEFAISQWSAWAPGLTSPEAWKAWALAADSAIPRGKDTPPLTEVPAMARRRVEKMGRLAFQVATWCQGEVAQGCPLIFASRHGDVGRSMDLLTSLAKNEPLSPTSFALSVHNAIGAQYSIIKQERAAVSAVSNGLFTLEAAMLEAAGLLTEVPEVLVVTYEASLPAFYEPFLDDVQSDFAFAWKVRRDGGERIALSSEAAQAEQRPGCHSLDVFRFFLSGAKTFTAGPWAWSRAS